MVQIREVPLGKGNLKEFLEVVDHIYRGDPNFVRALDFEIKERLSPKRNPFFQHAEGIAFTAHRNGKCVGRITAQVDREHLDRWKDGAGFFGFIDTIDDAEVAKALLSRAEQWLKARGMKQARGPMSLNTNEEIGCLVEGFETPPYIAMPHHKPYQSGLIEAAGYTKAKDVLAWHYRVGELNARTKKAQADILAMPEVSTRRLSMKDLERDLGTIVDIFNDAWSHNWGFVPLTRAEVKKMAQDFRMVIEPELTRIVLIDGEPAAFALAVPNLNEVIRDLHGKLSPVGLAKMLWRLKVRGPKTARLFFLGIRKRFQKTKRYAPLSAYLYAEMNEGGRRLGIKEGELSWTLEDNALMNAGIKTMGAKVHKRYRIFSKDL
jgi:hypothetical protein